MEITSTFCRAILCISAVSMPSCGCLSVRLSVLLSVTFVYCVKTSNRVLKPFYHQVATSQFFHNIYTAIFVWESP